MSISYISIIPYEINNFDSLNHNCLHADKSYLIYKDPRTLKKLYSNLKYNSNIRFCLNTYNPSFSFFSPEHIALFSFLKNNKQIDEFVYSSYDKFVDFDCLSRHDKNLFQETKKVISDQDLNLWKKISECMDRKFNIEISQSSFFSLDSFFIKDIDLKNLLIDDFFFIDSKFSQICFALHGLIDGSKISETVKNFFISFIVRSNAFLCKSALKTNIEYFQKEGISSIKSSPQNNFDLFYKKFFQYNIDFKEFFNDENDPVYILYKEMLSQINSPSGCSSCRKNRINFRYQNLIRSRFEIK